VTRKAAADQGEAAWLRNPRRLAELANKQIKAMPKQLYDALHRRLTDHYRFLLTLQLRHALMPPWS
jgi:hypothetical protein